MRKTFNNFSLDSVKHTLYPHINPHINPHIPSYTLIMNLSAFLFNASPLPFQVKSPVYYFRGCVGDEDDHFKQLCVDSNKVLLKRFCYNTLRNVYAVNKPVGTDDDDMIQWACSSLCCSCNGCNKVSRHPLPKKG